jgi:hypothetical protein
MDCRVKPGNDEARAELRGANGVTIDWGIVETAIPLLARGTLVTLKISLVAGVLACVLGFTLGLCALSHMRTPLGYRGLCGLHPRHAAPHSDLFGLFCASSHRHSLR